MSYSHLRSVRHVMKEGTLIVPSERYTEDMVEAMEMKTCSVAPTPITSVRKPDEEDGELLGAAQHKIFRRVVGTARYVRILRPDLVFVVK